MAGVGSVADVHLPEGPGGLRGTHMSLDRDRYLVMYQASEWEGAQEHTLLHETYEILQERLEHLFPGTRVPTGGRLCWEADRFAAAVLMQADVFTCCAAVAGLDAVSLQRQYRRSYASVTLRLAEVMAGQPLLAALYQQRTDAEWLVATVVVRTPGFGVKGGAGPELPRRGWAPPPGSVVDRVISERAPVYAGMSGPSARTQRK